MDLEKVGCDAYQNDRQYRDPRRTAEKCAPDTIDAAPQQRVYDEDPECDYSAVGQTAARPTKQRDSPIARIALDGGPVAQLTPCSADLSGRGQKRVAQQNNRKAIAQANRESKSRKHAEGTTRSGVVCHANRHGQQVRGAAGAPVIGRNNSLIACVGVNRRLVKLQSDRGRQAPGHIYTMSVWVIRMTSVVVVWPSRTFSQPSMRRVRMPRLTP